MEKVNKILIASAILVLVVVAVVTYFRPTTIQNYYSSKDAVPSEQLGAVAGNDNSSNITCSGGVCKQSTRGTCRDMTTNFLAVRNLLGATSSLTHLIMDVRNGSSTVALGVDIGTSTIAAATTTGVFDPILGAVIGGDNIREIIAGDTATDTQRVNSGTTTPYFIVGPNAVLQGWATGTVASLTNTNNTFSCTYDIEMTKF